MIVEFLGITGSGKTYVASQYCHYLEKQGEKYVWPWQELYSKNYIYRNAIKAYSVAKRLICAPKWCINLIRFLHQEGILRWRDYAVLTFNGIYLNHALNTYNQCNEFAIFDEGIAQYIWAIHFRNRRKILLEEMAQIRELFKFPNTLYVVTASSETILSRMMLRNVRDEIRERGNVEEEVANGQTMQHEVAKLFSEQKDVHVVFIDNEINVSEDDKVKSRFEALFSQG